MGGDFLKKLCKFIGIIMLLAASFWAGSVISDRMDLDRNLIRLHVVANSDSQEDQALKLRVRDGIMAYLEDTMEAIPDAQTAKQFLLDNLSEIERKANEVITSAGFTQSAKVTLQRECFDVRHYDTFSLPSGVYESLRITIGEGAGKNWWCVVFPGLCIPAASEQFSDTAAGAGFSDSLSSSLSGEKPYQVRFFLLDVLGKAENFFCRIFK